MDYIIVKKRLRLILNFPVHCFSLFNPPFYFVEVRGPVYEVLLLVDL